jgi:PKD repeat protein
MIKGEIFMLRRIITVCSLFLLITGFLLPAAMPVYAGSPTMGKQQHARADFPTVDPNYIYDQLFYMATSFQHREAGYDNNLPANINGHDEFANYWLQEMVKNLDGFGPQVRLDKFPVQGWQNRPAILPAFNVEVSVPGVTYPEQVVVIGCHYDGMAISTQSANDDASGCAIELGVARAMGQYWRSHHMYPARTLRFVIFDAEEQGLYGSFHYVNATINGDISNVVAMFNEEQNGIAYPLRYLGKMVNPLLPFYVYSSPLTNNSLYPHQDRLSQQQRNNIAHFQSLLQQAVIPVFEQFQALGFPSLVYHGINQRDVSQPVFTSDQVNNVQLHDDKLGSSDQEPFTLAGLPCATFVGNSTYYDNNPPPWSYPFDQKEDTIQLMNTFASGGSQKSQALVLALGLPGMLTTWMLNQPDILGEAPAGTGPIAAISDVGQTLVNHSIALDAKTSFDPNNSNANLNYAWNFGDGTSASGVSVNHVYTNAGTYTLSLTASSATGMRHVNMVIHVVTRITSYANPYTQYQSDGVPPGNPAVILPTPDDSQLGRVPTTSTPVVSPSSSGNSGGLLIAIVVAIVIVLGIAVVVGMRLRKKKV